MKDVITVFAEEPEKPKKSLAERVNEVLKKNMGPDDEEVRLEDIAKEMGVGVERLDLWLENNDEFKKNLERFIEVDESGIFKDAEFGNRADAMCLAMLFMEMKNKK